MRQKKNIKALKQSNHDAIDDVVTEPQNSIQIEIEIITLELSKNTARVKNLNVCYQDIR